MTNYTIGLDLGQTSDYTAFAVLEEKPSRTYSLRHIERHRNKPYPVLVDRLGRLVGQLPGTPSVAVDATGVGRPVVDMIEERGFHADVYAITLTGGDTPNRQGRDWRVPKRDVVSTVAVLLQTGRLRISRNLRDAEVLQRELLSFRAKITLSGNDTYEAWRERDHDDLVLAVGLACWLNEKGRNGWLLYIEECMQKRKAEVS